MPVSGILEQGQTCSQAQVAHGGLSVICPHRYGQRGNLELPPEAGTYMRRVCVCLSVCIS